MIMLKRTLMQGLWETEEGKREKGYHEFELTRTYVHGELMPYTVCLNNI